MYKVFKAMLPSRDDMFMPSTKEQEELKEAKRKKKKKKQKGYAMGRPICSRPKCCFMHARFPVFFS
jgi:hypothetical protein